MIQTEFLMDAFSRHVPADSDESAHRALTLDFVSAHPQCWWKRSTLSGHVTASALLVDAAGTHALMLYHRKLARWLQPGGHLDDTDESPRYGALRECREETGLGDSRLVSGDLFDIDVHSIPQRNQEPQHLHYDLRYLVQTARQHTVTISDESTGYRWVALKELIMPGNDPGISRMAQKFRALL